MIELSDEQLDLKSWQYRRSILQYIKHAGAGHTGGSLSCVDILNVLYNRVLNVSPQTFRDPHRDRYIQSKGHSVEALFVVLADQGFFEESELNSLCRYQSHFVGHPTRKIPGVEQNTGALGHGLPICVGTALAGKMDEADFRVFTLLGDGELAEGSNWEAAMCAVHHQLDNLTAIVDYNTLQLTGPTRDVCDNSPLDKKFASFGWTVRSVDGHNFEELTAALNDTPVEGCPTVVIANTIKGKGVSFMENIVKWHHGVPNDEEYARAIDEIDGHFQAQGGPIVSAPAPSMFSHDARDLLEQLKLKKGEANLEVFSKTVLSLAREDRNVVVVTSDSRGSGKLVPFAKELPKQIVEVGIAEQNLVGVSAGLAAAGKIPFAVSPGCFLTARSLEQIKNDVCYSDNPVKVIGISAGVSYGALGSTHHSIHDLAVLRAINNIDIVVPADNFETTQATRAAAAQTRPIYVRFGKAAMYDLPRANDDFEVGKARIIRAGTDVAFIATGETVIHALLAAEQLQSTGVSARVVSMHSIKPLDAEVVLHSARNCQAVVTVEEHMTAGGLGDACASVILEAGVSVGFKTVGIPDEYTVTGSQSDIFRHYGISMEGLVSVAEHLLSIRQETSSSK